MTTYIYLMDFSVNIVQFVGLLNSEDPPFIFTAQIDIFIIQEVIKYPGGVQIIKWSARPF